MQENSVTYNKNFEQVSNFYKIYLTRLVALQGRPLSLRAYWKSSLPPEKSPPKSPEKSPILRLLFLFSHRRKWPIFCNWGSVEVGFYGSQSALGIYTAWWCRKNAQWLESGSIRFDSNRRQRNKNLILARIREKIKNGPGREMSDFIPIFSTIFSEIWDHLRL